ncbi:MAG: Flp family type IVb pilin [Erysipelotrichaceae bacterium]|nr:Flp family type IVb pilin [Erysipelotrichaceae bacterium]
MKNWLLDESGQGMVEYGLIIALVSVVAILALTNIGKNLNTMFEKVNNALPKASGPRLPKF